MAHKTTNQPGSNDNQPHGENRNHDAHDTSHQRPNGEQDMTNANKSKQGEEDDHAPQGRQQTPGGKTKTELAEERGGHGHSGHSNSRNGSRKRQ